MCVCVYVYRHSSNHLVVSSCCIFLSAFCSSLSALWNGVARCSANAVFRVRAFSSHFVCWACHSFHVCLSRGCCAKSEQLGTKCTLCMCVEWKGWNNGYDRPSARPSTPFHFYSLWTYLYGKPEVTASVRTDRTQHVSVVWKVHEEVQWIALCFSFSNSTCSIACMPSFSCFPTALGAYNFVLPV